jgi:small-conductance mechanosensitive channel
MGGLFVFDVVLPRLRIDVPSIVRDLVLVTIGVAISMGFLRLAGLDVFSLVTTSAVLTAVIGLALQSTIANVFSGLGLQLDRTLRHGEWIEVGSRIGRILEIGWRSTRIETKDGDTIFVPNSELISKEVLNFARPSGAHRMTVRIGFHSRHPPNEVRGVLVAAIRGVPGILAEPSPDCGPIEFADSAVIYALRYWIEDFSHDTLIHEEVHTRIWYASRRAAFEMPFPTRTLVSQHGAAAARVAAEAHEEEEALRRLERTHPFSRLGPASRRRCVRGIRRLEFAQGEGLLEPDGGDRGLSVIESGEVAIRRPSAGGRHDVTLLGAGALFARGLLSHGDSCTAHSNVTLHRFDERALEDAFADEAELRAELETIAAARLVPTRSEPFMAMAAGQGDQSSEALRPRLRRLLGRR